MKNKLILSAADAAEIRRLIDPAEPHPGISATARNMLANLLEIARVTDNEARLENHVGLNDPVTLTNPDDTSDWYRMEIVIPTDADVDHDRISLSHPMCLAVLGRTVGEAVEWDTGHGVRHMRIAAFDKAGMACA